MGAAAAHTETESHHVIVATLRGWGIFVLLVHGSPVGIGFDASAGVDFHELGRVQKLFVEGIEGASRDSDSKNFCFMPFMASISDAK